MDVVFQVRDVDWEVVGWGRVTHTVRQTLRTLRLLDEADAVVICTSFLDAALAAVILRLRPGITLAVWDFLLPRRRLVRAVARIAMRRVDLWMIIRRGDEATFRTQMGARVFRFVPFLVEPGEESGSSDGQYVYAAGSAHRDWQTLVESIQLSAVPAVISTNDIILVPDDVRHLVTVIPLAKPEDGRMHMRGALAACVPLHDTELPCGPLVVLDAMRAGKVVVATDVNGTRDYVVSGRTGILVPPHDAQRLAEALAELRGEPARRQSMGASAREASNAFLPPRILRSITSAVSEVTPRASHRQSMRSRKPRG